MKLRRRSTAERAVQDRYADLGRPEVTRNRVKVSLPMCEHVLDPEWIVESTLWVQLWELLGQYEWEKKLGEFARLARAYEASGS